MTMTDTGPPSLVMYEDEEDEVNEDEVNEDEVNEDEVNEDEVNEDEVNEDEVNEDNLEATSLPSVTDESVETKEGKEMHKSVSLPTLNGMETSSVDQISDDEGDVPSQTNSPARRLSPESKTTTSKPPRKKAKIEATLSLVSYGYGDDDDEAEEEEEEEEEEMASDMDVAQETNPTSRDNSGGRSPRRPSPRDVASTEEEEEFGDAALATANRSSLDQDLATSLSRSVRDLAPNEIEIPPAPNGRCSAALVNKVLDAKEKMRQDPNYDINLAIQSNKAFRNPSIYDKIVTFLRIDEKGTNYPPEAYNPYVFGKESFYDELAKAQKNEVEKRERERKERGKVDFVSAESVKKDLGNADMRKRSKWDMSPGKKSAQQKTQIPAVGNILKKK